MGVIEINTEDLLSVDQASQETGVPRPTLYRWIDKDKIKAVKIGGTIYIPKTELDNIRKQRLEPEGEN
ncbi:MAG: helix-turn-helix domain-containing protein [Dehalococcoidales bacterium]|nr:helix-turn-helix domain-containing protein [Dehalococcoidales bacterium]